MLDGICRVCCSYRDLKIGVFIGYSRSIRGIFTGYSYVSVMCRLCIGYVSVMYRNRHGDGWGDNYGIISLKEIETPARCAHEILINLIITRLVANFTTKVAEHYR